MRVSDGSTTGPVVRLWVCPCCGWIAKRDEGELRNIQLSKATAKLSGKTWADETRYCQRCSTYMKPARQYPPRRKRECIHRGEGGRWYGVRVDGVRVVGGTQFRFTKRLFDQGRIQPSPRKPVRTPVLKGDRRLKRELANAERRLKLADSRLKRAKTLQKKWTKRVARLKRKIAVNAVLRDTENGDSND